jgi:hypothetical protein
MVYVPSSACIVALISVLLLARQTVGVRHRDREKNSANNSYKVFVNENDQERQAMFSDSSDSLMAGNST